MNQKLEDTISKLMEVIMEDPKISAVAEMEYSSENTGTVVYKVYASNITQPHSPSEYKAWTYMIIGNNEGYVKFGEFPLDKIDLSVIDVFEDKKVMNVKFSEHQKGYQYCPGIWEFKIFAKKDFKPYNPKKKS